MSTPACSCAAEITKLTQQVSVMRREIKNLRQQIDGSIRAHRTQLSSLQSMLTDCVKPGSQSHSKTHFHSCSGSQSLQQGRIQTLPIGHVSSCFAGKTGTPRQPSICSSSRASVKIHSSVFSNPEHALVGLEHFSHVWIIFLFHKNGQLSYKAKVKPPRLNGQKVGVYSTRSPHRPNALGLTLAKLERITGDTLHLSGVDFIAGTPVLDIKPYIPDYDSPAARTDDSNSQQEQTFTDAQMAQDMELDEEPDVLQTSEPYSELSPDLPSDLSCSARSGCRDVSDVLAEVKDYLKQEHHFNTAEGQTPEAPECSSAGGTSVGSPELSFGQEVYSSIATWVRAAPVSDLDVRFTACAEKQLKEFVPCSSADSERPKFQFLKGPDEAVTAIRCILSADPRSVYRRTRCPDRLFFFSLDTAHITCWFGDGFAEVVRVKPVQTPELTGAV